MLQPQCLRCGASSQGPLCAKCLAFLVEHRPLLFDPRLDSGPSTVELLSQQKRLMVTADPKRPLVAYDDKTWDWKSEESAASILKHMGFNGGQPSLLSFGDSEVLHEILFRYSSAPSESLELASRLESLRMRTEEMPFPVVQEIEPGITPSPEKPSIPQNPTTTLNPSSAEREKDPLPPMPPPIPDQVEPERSLREEPLEAPEPESNLQSPRPPTLQGEPLPTPPERPPERPSYQTPPPAEAVAAAKDLEQLNAEIQRLSMIKNQMERQKDQVQSMLQVERQALEEREVLVTAQAATLQSRQKEIEERSRDVLEKEADLRRIQHRLDLMEFLTSIPGLDRKDINQIRSTFQDLDSIKVSSVEDMIALANLEEMKATAIYAALHPKWADEDLSQRAQTLLEEGDHHGALGCYEAMLRKNPDDETIWFNKAEVLGILGDREGALQAYTRVLELNKRNIVAWREKSNLLFEASRLEEAIRALRSLMELDRGQADLVLARADELVAKRMDTDAILLYNAILETDPGNVKAYMGLGDCLLKLGDTDMADKMYTRALGRDPQNPRALYRKGYLLNRRGRWGAALQLFNRAIALDWNYASPWVGKGDILLKQGKNGEALECFNKAIEFESARADAWAGKARAHLTRGENEEAASARKEAMEIDNKCEAVLEMERTFERGAEEVVETRKVTIKEDSGEILNKVLKGSRTILESQVIRKLSDLALERGEAKAALDGYEAALKMDPSDADAWCGKGLVLRSLGRVSEARDAYDQALRLNPNREDARRGREECTDEGGKR